MSYPKAFLDIVDSFRQLPGVGQKTAERYAFAVLEMDDVAVKEFSESLTNSYTTLRNCQLCGFLTANDTCEFCQDQKRDQSTICIVSYDKDVIAMENTKAYQGLYHVLKGVISTSKGTLPEDLNFNSLLKRLDNIKEVIIATSFTLEGETTALYLSKLLASFPDITISRLAHGLPVGSQLDYADELTLMKAMHDRKQLKDESEN